MSQNLHLIPQPRKSLAPLRTDHNGASPTHAFLVDEYTFWIGRDFTFRIQNPSRFPRWYRIVVTNLKPKQEYRLFSHHDPLEESRPLEVAAGEEAPITLTLGGEDPREPETPKSFEVYVQEYATADERGQPRELLHEQLNWIPQPDEHSLYLSSAAKVVRVRPWQRRAGFEVSLVNRSYLPVTAAVQAAPTDGKEAGIEGTQETLRDPIPPQQEQPIRCEVRMEKPLKAPVLVNVEAQIGVPALELERSAAARPVQLVPVPLLKVWYDWMVVALLAFLLLWALFGMPPWVHPSTRVVLTFPDGLPANPQQLQLTLTPFSLDGSTPNLGKLIRTAPTEVNSQQNQLVYDFDWKPMWRGFRWTWRKYPLQLAWGPNASSQNMNASYPLPELEHVSISRLSGVNVDNIPVTLSPTLGVSLLIEPDQKALAGGEDITLQIIANGVAQAPQVYVQGQMIRMPAGTTTVEVNASTSTLQARWPAHAVTARKEPYAVPLTFVVTKPIAVNIPTEPKPVQAPPVMPPKKDSPPPNSSKPQDKPAPKTSAPNPAAQHPAVQPNRPPPVVPQPPVGLKPDQVMDWCKAINLAPFADALEKESAKPDALKLNVANPIPARNGEYQLPMTANEACWIQVYMVTKDGTPQPWYGNSDAGVQDEQSARPIQLTGLLTLRIKWDPDHREIVVLACKQPKEMDATSQPSMDLQPMLMKDKDTVGWAIAGIPFPAQSQPNGDSNTGQ